MRKSYVEVQTESFFTDRYGHTNIHISKEGFLSEYQAFTLPKYPARSLYREAVNVATARMHSYGFFLHFKSLSKFIFVTNGIDARMQHPIIPRPARYIQLEHLSGAFYLLFTCLLITFISLIIEMRIHLIM